ncbi:MAG: hypothetical protein M1812_006605 [Candelaria pacifica]|nr:MAG: hypothetical protein M1812_006605 [Candelaria pacifica]
MGLRVVCLDIMGFGGTDAPRVPPEDISLYGFKRAADDIKELAHQLEAPKIIMGGHDWGGAIVYRVALWHPELVTNLFSVCTPYWPPTDTYTPLTHLVNTKLPNFRYQVQLGGKEVEDRLKTREDLKQFLNGVYGGQGPKGEVGFNTESGVLLDNLPKLGLTKLLSDRELDYYADEYARHGIHGTLNWYRNRKQNFDDEYQRFDSGQINIPVLFIQATQDSALPPALSANMDQFIPNLTRKEVDADHWALWQTPLEVNDILKAWFEQHVFGSKSSL